jgi:hypothetical protein
MRYTVTTSYAGSVQLSVEADNEEQACEIADDRIDEMDASTFLSEVELQSMGRDCWEEKPVVAKHPIAEIPDLFLEEMAKSAKV